MGGLFLFVFSCLDMVMEWSCFCPDPPWSQNGLASVDVPWNRFHPAGEHRAQWRASVQLPPSATALLFLSLELNWFSAALYFYQRFLFDSPGRWKASQERGPLSFDLWSSLSYSHWGLCIISFQDCLLMFGGGCTELQGSLLILSFNWNLLVRIKTWFLLYANGVLEVSP